MYCLCGSHVGEASYLGGTRIIFRRDLGGTYLMLRWDPGGTYLMFRWNQRNCFVGTHVLLRLNLRAMLR